ncbi:hypothetical protein AOQ84DRAFT_407028 [Glonium stellatum]|uniref:Uncharacterized protein n=1 Tax=Glonium stellatum TaxID=574774 RepID=A0A8E2JTA1_9PEZI|nr:hypothetical protein AOQ84DRAFT_407028 [Glonium stellatum]
MGCSFNIRDVQNTTFYGQKSDELLSNLQIMRFRSDKLYLMPHHSRPLLRRSSETVYYSETRLKQRYFPMRRKTTKTMSRSTPTLTERQQTMTQVGYVPTPAPSKRKRGKSEEIEDSKSETESDEPRSSDEKRQQTLTQMIHGVRPTPSYEDNWNVPAPKRKRGNRTTREKRQQTLTQMTHGLMPIPIGSDDEDEDDGYALAIEQHLAGHGIYKPAHERSPPRSPVRQRPGSIEHLHEWMTDQKTRAHKPSLDHVASSRLPTKAKIENPKTPPRRRVLEVPSSQSPESPLSTQKSSECPSQYPLQQRSPNARYLLKSPSTGRTAHMNNSAARKSVPQTNVVFEGEQTGYPQASRDRIFQNTIQDSEEGELESDNENAEANSYGNGNKTQAFFNQADLDYSSTDPINGLSKGIENDGCIAENDSRLSAGSNLTPVPADRTNSRQIVPQNPNQPTYIQSKSLQTISCASQSAHKSQESIETGTEDAAAQLQTKFEPYTQHQTAGRSPSFKTHHLEHNKQRIQDSNPVPTQSSHLSQATIVDSTLFSPRNPHHFLPLPPISPSMPPPLTIPSSLPSLMSSPNISRVNTGADSPSLRKIGARIVTASQMVPESPEDYSVPPPPPWNYDGDDDDDDDDDDEEL